MALEKMTEMEALLLELPPSQIWAVESLVREHLVEDVAEGSPSELEPLFRTGFRRAEVFKPSTDSFAFLQGV